MKIIHIIDDLSPAAGGLSQMVPKFCAALAEQNVNVSVASFGESLSDAAADSLANGLDIRNNAFSRFSHVKYLLGSLPSIVRGFDVVHLHAIWLPCNWSAGISSKRKNIPFVVSLHGTLEPWALNHKAWKKKIAWWAIEKKIVEGASVLHATAGQEADHLRKLGLRNPIAVIPNGVDLPILQERTDSNGAPRTALFLSRIHPIKGLLNLVEAWRRVHPLGWKLVIAGTDEDGYQVQVKAAVRNAGLEGLVDFTGPVYGEAKRELFQSADLFVLPTFSENFGLVVAEALAFGVPVITTKGAPWRELQEHGCGWWVDIGVEPLVEALREAVSLSDDDRRAMGARGRRLVAERYAWSSVAKEMKAVYEWVLGGGQPPPCVMTE